MQKKRELKANTIQLCVFLAVACILIPGTGAHLYAQRIEALVSASDDWSFFVQPETKTTRIGNEIAQFAGIRLGPALEHRLHIGLTGQALISSVEPKSDTYRNLHAFDLWYAGLAASYTFLPNKLTHASVGCLIGGGQLRANRIISDTDTANIFIAEPEVALLFNLTETIELGFGFSLRIVNGSDLDGLKNTDLMGPAGSIFLRWTEAP